MDCLRLAGRGRQRSVLVISNDRDLFQLLDDNVSVLQIPTTRGETSLGPYRVMTAKAYSQQWDIDPYFAPLFDALTGRRIADINCCCVMRSNR